MSSSIIPSAITTRLPVEGPAPVDGVDAPKTPPVGVGLKLTPSTPPVGVGVATGVGAYMPL